MNLNTVTVGPITHVGSGTQREIQFALRYELESDTIAGAANICTSSCLVGELGWRSRAQSIFNETPFVHFFIRWVVTLSTLFS